MADDEEGVYRERARLAAFVAACYPAVKWLDPAEPGYTVVGITTPRGQLSWHIKDTDLDLFGHVTEMVGQGYWDGHSTVQKYRRLESLCVALAGELAEDRAVAAELAADGFPPC